MPMQEVVCGKAESKGVEVRVMDCNLSICRISTFLSCDRFGKDTPTNIQMDCAVDDARNG